MEQADRVRAAADAGDHGVGQPARLRRASARAPRCRSRSAARAPGTDTDAGPTAEPRCSRCRSGSADPVAKRLVDGRAQRLVAARHRHDCRRRAASCGRRSAPAAPCRPRPCTPCTACPSRAQAAAVATPCWPAPVSATIALRAEPLREQRLADRVVDLVRAGVREVLALEPHLRAPAPATSLCACVSAVGRPTQLRSSRVELRLEGAVGAGCSRRRLRAARAPAPASRARSGRRTGRSGRARRGMPRAASRRAADRDRCRSNSRSMSLLLRRQCPTARAARRRRTRGSAPGP